MTIAPHAEAILTLLVALLRALNENPFGALTLVTLLAVGALTYTLHKVVGRLR